MADTDDTGRPVDMNALLRNRDRDGTVAAWHARLFGTGTGTDTGTDTDDGGDSAA